MQMVRLDSKREYARGEYYAKPVVSEQQESRPISFA
jgi:hypothetical protein